MNMFRYVRAVLVTGLLALSLAGCGGNDATSSATSTTLSGTAATGAPITNSDVLLKDSNGGTKNTITDASGKFSFDVSGLTPPFLLKTSVNGTDLYSIATQAGTVNIHPLTDLIVRNYVNTYGDPLDRSRFKASDIAAIESDVRLTIATQLRDKNLDENRFNLLATPFDADKTKFDAVLDSLKVKFDSVGAATIVRIDVNGKEGASIREFTNDGMSAVNPLKDGINKTLTNWKNASNNYTVAFAAYSTANAAYPALFASYSTAAGITPGATRPVRPTPPLTADPSLTGLYSTTPPYLNQGLNAVEDIDATLKDNPPGNISVYEVKDIVAVDMFKSIITVTASITSDKWGSKTLLPMSFIKVNDQWLFYGDQRVAGIKVELLGTALNMSVYDPKGQLASATVIGPGTGGTRTLIQDSADPKKFLLSLDLTSQLSGSFGMGEFVEEAAESPDRYSGYTFTLVTTAGKTYTYQVAPAAASLLDPHGH